MGGLRFNSFAATYKCYREHYNTYSDDYYGEPDTNELRAEDNEFKPKIHEKPVTDKD